jgi:dynein heavy chain
MISEDGEIVPFNEDVRLEGAVESYMTVLEAHLRLQLRDQLEHARGTADNWELDNPRAFWLEAYCSQLGLVVTQIIWTEETNRAFEELESGSETAMKEYAKVCADRIEQLIFRVQTDLSGETRNKIITVITIDVHSRDVVDMFVAKKIADPSAFAWQSQLKFYWAHKPQSDRLVSYTPDDQKTCVIRICDWVTIYCYEYVGNCGRLVITPLTDRCYITLSQALNLTLGGAPAGPAGTGKTETTKDLSRAIGLQIVVFNCSDQMSYLTTANIFMGLAQTGAWGCFDEFNRIKIEVLSVVSTQVKYVLDAIVEIKKNPAKVTFNFMDVEIGLRPTVGFFITMNPGYAGRTELPENLKALFRSCAMVVPDITLICENMLLAEGFSEAKDLSKKFMCLYDLAKSLLSKQIHYDWGLRAVKSVLRQAGGLKRGNPDEQEKMLLMRGLKFFNKPKIVIEDWPIFCGLIDGLFNNLEAEEFSDPDLEQRLIKAARSKNIQAKSGEGLVPKCIQFAEILDVRHSVFIIGHPGSAKSTIWKVLADAFNLSGTWDTIYEVIDPKAVTSNELYGFINPKTKDWKDGNLSVIMRNMNKCLPPFKENHMQKWLVLDGDVDPEWIETMNTVMDDNKTLTLVSQERIPLTPSMKLVLEVSNLSQASPATVSRGGVLFVNESDVGWEPYFQSWLTKYKNDDIAELALQLALTTYMNPSYMDELKNRIYITPICDMQKVCSLTTIIDYLYKKLHTDKAQLDHLKSLKEANAREEIQSIYDAFFVFAGMWALGAGLDEDKLWFSGNWKSSSKIKFPENGQCFDYYFDPIKHEWVLWDDVVISFNKEYEGLY